jgi:hypothetical protein
MKTLSFLVLLLGTAVATFAQTFRATLAPVTPTPDNSWITGAAAFALSGPTVSFTISLGLEDVVPTIALLNGPQSTFTFDLGPPFNTIHSPGPWPNGYDGSTAFFGSFVMPDQLREDFLAGRTTLHLFGSRVGDFSGPVLPALAPQIGQISQQSSSLQIQFRAEAPYQYTVEYMESLGTTNTVILERVPALSQTFEAVVTDSVTANGARFYRIRRELCCH